MTIAGWGWGEGLGWALTHSVWQGALLTGGLACVLRLLPTSWVDLRYRLALSTLVLAVLIPLASSVGLSADWHRHRTCRGPDVLDDGVCSGHGRPTEAVRPSPTPREGVGVAGNRPLRIGTTVRILAIPGAGLLPTRVRGLARAATGLMGWIAIGWMVGLALATVGLARSILAVRRIWRTAVPVVDGAPWSALSDSLARMGSPMDVQLRTTRDVPSPAVTCGRPGRILLPEEVAGLLSPSELRAVFAHELAHLRGRDPAAALAQAAICGAFFFNPFVLALSRTVDREREALRDAQAAEALGSRRRYGETLLTLAGLQAARARAGVVGLVGEGDLSRRIRRLGDQARVVLSAGPRTLLAGSLAVIVVAVLVASAATAGTLSSWAVMANADHVAAAGASVSLH